MLDPAGRPWSYFRWEDPADTRDIVEVLRSEGTILPGATQASPTVRLTADDLRALPAHGPERSIDEAYEVLGSAEPGASVEPPSASTNVL